MMTLAGARLRLRRWLEDESASPLWSDEQLDEGLTAGLAEVSEISPAVVVETRTAAYGDMAMDAPASYRRLRSLLDPLGLAMLFDVVGSEIRPFGSGYFDPGDYTLLYEKSLTMPAVDTDEVPCPARLESLMLAAAAYWCLSQRATAESKRGGVTTSERARIEATRQDLDTLRRQARRVISATTLVV